MNDTWTIFTDGGARGNPGPAAYAYVIKRPGAADIEAKAYLGSTTNNIAEYTGMLRALEHAKRIGGKKLIINSDSELMVKQMNGVYKVKNEGLKALYQQATALRRQFESVTFKHVYREQNSQADGLCNEAMDDRSPTESESVRENASLLFESHTTTIVAPQDSTGALAIIQECATAWATGGNPNDPPPADVLKRIMAIVRQA